MMLNNANLQNFNNNYAVPMQLNPVPYGQDYLPLGPNQELVPIIVPVAAPTGPLLVQPVLPQIITTIPEHTDLYVPNNGILERALVSEQCVQFGEATFSAPDGFSFVSIDDYFRFGLNLMVVPTSSPEPEISQETNPLAEQDRNQKIETTGDASTEAPKQQKKQGVKHPHRSKQKKIMAVHSMVEELWKNKGKLAGDDEVLRGEDVLRIHVKTWEGLDLISDVLDHVEQCVPINRIALPFSMKNKFQKKGFIVYLKLNDKIHVPTVQAIFAQHKEHFKKCDVALPTQKTIEPTAKDISIDLFLPPVMQRRESAGAAA